MRERSSANRLGVEEKEKCRHEEGRLGRPDMRNEPETKQKPVPMLDRGRLQNALDTARLN